MYVHAYDSYQLLIQRSCVPDPLLPAVCPVLPIPPPAVLYSREHRSTSRRLARSAESSEQKSSIIWLVCSTQATLYNRKYIAAVASRHSTLPLYLKPCVYPFMCVHVVQYTNRKQHRFVCPPFAFSGVVDGSVFVKCRPRLPTIRLLARSLSLGRLIK